MKILRTCEVGLEPQLFIDDHLIDDLWLLRRAPEEPVRHLGNPLLPHGGGTIIYDREEQVFKMWYGIPIPGTHEARGAYALSSDGLRWEKPPLGLVEHEGSRRNNLLATDGFGHVLKDPHDPDPARRYKMMTKRKATAASDGRAFAAFSPDGIRWHDHPGEKSIIRDSSDGNGCVLYDEALGRYVNFRRPTIRAAGRTADWPSLLGLPGAASPGASGKGRPGAKGGDPQLEEDFAEKRGGGPGAGFPAATDFAAYEEAEDFLHRYLRPAPYVHARTLRLLYPRPELPGLGRRYDKPCNRRIARAESDDFINWSEPAGIIMPDELDPPKLYGISVFRYHGLYLGFLQVYHSWGNRGRPGCPLEPETMDTQLAFSRDGWRWERLASRPVFIRRGLIGSFDAGMISSVRMVEHGEDLFFYYAGSSHSHNIPGGCRGLGLARLPKERLVARRAGDEPGMLITRPFRLEGARLAINAKARRGVIRAELTDETGRPLEGFALEDCRNISGDRLRLPVTWAGGPDAARHRGRLVRLRFVLWNAGLYSFAWSR